METAAKEKLIKQINNTDKKQFEESIFPHIFDEIARECYVEHIDSFGKLFENSDYYYNIMIGMASMMYEYYRKKEDELPLIPELFKQKLHLVKQWRNSESHNAPDASMQELNSAIHIVSTMYLWVIAQNMKSLNFAIGK